MSNKGPRKLREKSDIDMLQAYVTYKRARNEGGEEDEELLRSISNVCSQVGTYKAKYEHAVSTITRWNDQLNQAEAEVKRVARKYEVDMARMEEVGKHLIHQKDALVAALEQVAAENPEPYSSVTMLAVQTLESARGIK